MTGKTREKIYENEHAAVNDFMGMAKPSGVSCSMTSTSIRFYASRPEYSTRAG